MGRTKSKSVSDSRRRGKHNADRIDRISDLPDSVIGHILSFLPIENAVATDILSKRWKHLWTTNGNLEFHFPNVYTGGLDVEQFVQFVNNVMLLHTPAGYYTRFSLIWVTGCVPIYVNKWICDAVAKDVHELIVRIEISKELPIQVLSNLFTSNNLRSLDLHCTICLSTEIVVSFPSLEILKLWSVYFHNEEALGKFIDGCPVLNYLVMDMNIWKMRRSGGIKCVISSATLRRIDLYVLSRFGLNNNLDQFQNYTAFCSVKLETPSLEFAMLAHQINCIVVIPKRLKFLRHVGVHLTRHRYEMELPNYCNSFVETLHGLSCTKILNLSEEAIAVLSRASNKMQTGFDRLTRLWVHIYRNFWPAVQDFIELSKNLEVLMVDNEADYYDAAGPLDIPNWTNPTVVPGCLSNSLRTVSLGGYHGHPDELAMIKYIIERGSVLESTKICFSEQCSGKKFEHIRLISTFPVLSPICDVTFLSKLEDL